MYIPNTQNQLNQKFYGISFQNTTTGFAVGAKNTDSTPSGVIQITTDSCDTWNMPIIDTLNPGILKDVVISEQVVWVAGHNSTILKSTNGINWTKDESFIDAQGAEHNLISICVHKGRANVTGDEGTQGYYYYYIPSVLDGVTYTFTAVDTLWIKILQSDGITYKKGFVSALNVTTT